MKYSPRPPKVSTPFVFTSIPSGIGYEDVDTTMEDAAGKKSLL